MRNNPTPTELGLWKALKKSLIGEKFTRQYQIGDYFVDFCCRQRKLVLELDGSVHEGRVEEDALRDAFLRSAGYEVLRIRVDRWVTEPESVLTEIGEACDSRPRFRY